MNFLDRINKQQTLGDLEKGAFQGNQHVDAQGGGMEYHSGVKGVETFTATTPPADGFKLTAAAERTGLFRTVIVSQVDKSEAYRSAISYSTRDEAMQHGRQVLSGAAPGMH